MLPYLIDLIVSSYLNCRFFESFSVIASLFLKIKLLFPQWLRSVWTFISFEFCVSKKKKKKPGYAMSTNEFQLYIYINNLLDNYELNALAKEQMI